MVIFSLPPQGDPSRLIPTTYTNNNNDIILSTLAKIKANLRGKQGEIDHIEKNKKDKLHGEYLLSDQLRCIDVYW